MMKVCTKLNSVPFAKIRRLQRQFFGDSGPEVKPVLLYCKIVSSKTGKVTFGFTKKVASVGHFIYRNVLANRTGHPRHCPLSSMVLALIFPRLKQTGQYNLR